MPTSLQRLQMKLAMRKVNLQAQVISDGLSTAASEHLNMQIRIEMVSATNGLRVRIHTPEGITLTPDQFEGLLTHLGTKFPALTFSDKPPESFDQ
jgi:hypothetical protein